MRNFVATLITEIDNELTSLKQSQISICKYSESAFKIYTSKSNVLKERFLKHDFKSFGEEIEFFKELKPLIESPVIYHSLVYKIESGCSSLPKNEAVRTVQKEINKIRAYFKQKKDLFTYYKTENSIADQYYFVRSESIHRVYQFKDADFTYSTGFDKYFIKIKAFELLLDYCNRKISDSENYIEHVPAIVNSDVEWTASKTDLVELLYSLYSSKAVNNGNLELTKLASILEQAFNVDLKEYYRTYSDLKIRANPHKFLEKCIDSLRQKMDREL